MLAALTITLGWWILPAVITAVLFAVAWDDERAAGNSFGAGLSYFFAALPSLAAWVIYLLAALFFGIR